MTEVDQGVDLRCYLFGESAEKHGDSVDMISRMLHDHGPARTVMCGIERLGAKALNVVDEQVASMVHQRLKCNVGDLLIKGWCTYTLLMQAAKRTVDRPGLTETVPLEPHTITWTYRPTVDVLVNGQPTATLDFELTAELMIKPLSLVVRHGHLESLNAGEGSVTTQLTLKGAAIIPRHEQQITDLAVLLPLRHPIRLVAPGSQLTNERA